MEPPILDYSEPSTAKRPKSLLGILIGIPIGMAIAVAVTWMLLAVVYWVQRHR